MMKRIMNKNNFSSSSESTAAHTNYTSNSTLSSPAPAPSAKKVWTSRAIFLIFLFGIAVVLGYVSHRLLTDSEQRLARGHFDEIADRALDTALAITLRRRLAAKSVATTIAYTFSDTSSWPNASMPSFEAIASGVMETTGNRATVGVCTLVTPNQLASFEDYFYNVAFKTINPNYPDDVGMRDFDGDGVLEEGVFGYDAGFQMYRETDGKAWWNSTYDIMCPFTMHSAGSPILMYNIHSFKEIGQGIDDVINCVNNRSDEVVNNETLDLSDCAMMTDMFPTFKSDGTSNGPNTFVIQPVYPANDPSSLTAIVTSGVIWTPLLEGLFTADVDGIDIVLQTDTKTFTYHIHSGLASLKGEGALNDPNYSKHAHSIDLDHSESSFNSTSVHYKVTLYPDDSFFEAYSTNNPWMATLVIVFSVVLTALFFLTYDFFVQQEFLAKQAILEAKRLYVRYVSHEVRTPLNTVCMGLVLLRDEISSGVRSLHSLDTTTEVEPLKYTCQWDNSGADCRETEQRLLALTDEVLNNAQGAVDVLNDLLNYDRIERGLLGLEIEVVSIWRLIERTANEFRLQATAQKLDFTLDMSAVLAKNGDRDRDPESLTTTFAKGVEEEIIVGDPIKIAQSVRNIVSNALKFTPAGGNLTIQASWLKPTSKVPASERLETFTLHSGEEVNFPSSGFLELSVSDSGPGLTEDQMAELFHDGVQFNVNNLQVGQGSGLGLFITKGIVERHGGRLSVASEGLGKGSTFTMTLPLHHHRLDHFASSSSLEAPEREVHSPQTDPAEKHGLVTPIPMELPFYHQPETASLNQSTRATAPATTVSHLVSEKEKRDDSQVHQQAEKKCMAEQPAEKRSHHILVVDDCAVNRRLLTRLLTRAGHACDEAQDGQVAVDQVGAAMEKGSLYDTILLDYEMPVMNGPTAAAEMRKVGCDSLIVGVTGNLMRDDIEYFKGMGANEVLPKPFKMKDLNQFWAEHNFG